MGTKHAPNNIGNDATLCCLANEAYEDGMSDEPVVYAGPGEAVTCEDCRSIIDHCRSMFGINYIVRGQASKGRTARAEISEFQRQVKGVTT